MCMTPLQIKHHVTGEWITVPCGKCPTCIARRISGWSFRLLREGVNAESAYFLTLTYDTDNVPITKRGFMSLHKSNRSNHLQLFFKKLRKAHGDNHTPIKYYAVGEYGGKSFRPHYHIIIFNLQLELVMSYADVQMLRYTGYNGKVSVNLLPWGLGSCTVGQVSGASIGYCFKYLSKPSRIPIHAKDDRIPEFAQMSKGLGLSYLSPAVLQWHHADLINRLYLNCEGGKKASLPRYYKDKIYSDEQRKIISIAYRQKALAEESEGVTTDQFGLKRPVFTSIEDYCQAIAVQAAFTRAGFRNTMSPTTL